MRQRALIFTYIRQISYDFDLLINQNINFCTTFSSQSQNFHVVKTRQAQPYQKLFFHPQTSHLHFQKIGMFKDL